MKFKKALLVNIRETGLEKQYWEQFDSYVEKKVFISRDDANFISELKDCDLLCLGFQVPIDKSVIEAATNLKLINVFATAYGTIDTDAAAQRDIPVCNLGGYSTESVAEFVIAALLNQIRCLNQASNNALNNDYELDYYRAREIKGSNFGVIGLGRIGGRVAELASGFGANVSYYSKDEKDVSYSYKTLEDILRDSDFISINVSENETSANLLNSSNISLIKSGGVVVSTVPNSIVNTDALVSRLAKDDMTYIFDHADEMTADELAKVSGYKNCIRYPAIAFISKEATIARQSTFVKNIAVYLDGDTNNKVN